MIRKVFTFYWDYVNWDSSPSFSLSFLSSRILPQNVLNLFFNSFYFHSDFFTFYMGASLLTLLSPLTITKPLASTGYSLYLNLNFVILQMFIIFKNTKDNLVSKVVNPWISEVADLTA
jgi:hypothetical protein